ncbi:hypothetical protein SAMN04489860_0883 [Paraoerskovia marina]|uniref:Uncharacterized protein n=1 Tax=Paraoerskovia marina TaxID=545619 RepID=A0A1H1PRI8_9CELL|nr:hypothetical protein [Paraoerskovia marina]SDS13774.1 hypothetical protein SAMN04489860_0883 [Paraoerskovia marina]
MRTENRSVATACLAALVAVAAYFGPTVLAGAATLLVLLVVIGWPALLDLPAAGGTRFVIALAGFGAVATVYLTEGEQALRNLPLVLAMALLLAFVNEFLRRDGRERLVDSVTGTVSGVVVAVAAAGWLASARGDSGVPLVVACAVGLAIAAAFAALPLRGWWSEVATVGVAVAAAGLVGWLTPDLGLARGLWAGVVAGVVVASNHLLFDRVPVVRDSRAAGVAAICVPVAVTGAIVYVVGRVLAG